MLRNHFGINDIMYESNSTNCCGKDYMSQTPSSVARRLAVLHEITISNPEARAGNPFLGSEVDDPDSVARPQSKPEDPPAIELHEGRLRQFGASMLPDFRAKKRHN